MTPGESFLIFLIYVPVALLAIFFVIIVFGGLGVLILSPIERALDKVADKNTPDRYKKQQEVWDSYQQIHFKKVNLRGTTIKQMMEKEHCLPEEAELFMIGEDMEDMGIKMNIAYADRLTHASYVRQKYNEVHNKFQDNTHYETQALPGRTPLTREQVAAKYAAQKTNS